MIPVVSRVRTAAYSAVCTSNLRQIYIAFQLYLADNRNQAPKTWEDNLYWHHHLSRVTAGSSGSYIGSQNVLICPAVKDNPRLQPIDYAYTSPEIWYPTSHKMEKDPFFFQKLLRPSDWPMFMDGDRPVVWNLNNSVATTDFYYRFAARHDGNANIVMADGHVVRAKYGDQRWTEAILNDGSYYSP
jgi:prepilin-type processing-associated H-X9-DG protein